MKKKNEYEDVTRNLDLESENKKFDLSKLYKNLEIEWQKIENEEKW